MDFLLENILNLVGFLVGLTIGIVSYAGLRSTGSPVLFRLTLAFFSISAGFFAIWIGFTLEDFVFKSGAILGCLETLGVAMQTVGYFFIAFSHSIKSFFPKSRYLRSVAVLPLFLVSSVYIENILRSVSFILLVYGAIETFMSYFSSRKVGALMVGTGLALLALGEFAGWYSFVFPDQGLYYASISTKIAGLILLFIPVSRIPLRRTRVKELDPNVDD